MLTLPEQTIIFYGNCQAQNLYEVLRRNPAIAGRYRVLYQSAVVGSPPAVTLDDCARCAIFVNMEMVVSNALLSAEHINPDCRTIAFKSFALNSLYPFYSPTNPYNVPRPPAAPWGAFPYGDTAIEAMIDAGLEAAEILDTYLNCWERYAPDLDKLHRFDCARLARLDAHSDIKIADFMLDNFRRTRFFFTTYHPTPALFAEVLVQLVRLISQTDPALAAADILATQRAILQTNPRGPLGSILIPVHPRVAEHFGLTWFDPHERFELPNEPLASYERFYAAMIAEFIAVKAARAQALPA